MTTNAPEEYGPPAPLRLWTYRYFHPAYHQWQTLDCAAVTAEDALRSARRFIRREAKRVKVRQPYSVYDMRPETAAPCETN